MVCLRRNFLGLVLGTSSHEWKRCYDTLVYNIIGLHDVYRVTSTIAHFDPPSVLPKSVGREWVSEWEWELASNDFYLLDFHIKKNRWRRLTHTRTHAGTQAYQYQNPCIEDRFNSICIYKIKTLCVEKVKHRYTLTTYFGAPSVFV